MPLVARIPLEPLLRLATFLLILVAAVLLGRLTWAILEPSSLMPAVEPLSEATAPGTASSTVSLASFRELAGKSILGSANAPAPVQIDAPETTLSWVLKGVFSNPDPALGAAILAPQGQPEKLYRVGASLPGNVRLEQVLADRVLLARDGKLETLRLRRAETVSRSAPRAAPALPSVDPGVTLASDGGVARIDRDAWVNDPQRFLDVITVNPVMVEGALYGLEVRPSRNAREFEAAGLQSGDVILEVEGRAVAEINDYREILQELSGASSVSVSLERGGEPMNITITMD